MSVSRLGAWAKGRRRHSGKSCDKAETIMEKVKKQECLSFPYVIYNMPLVFTL